MYSMHHDCTIYKTVDFISKKWTLLILLELYKGKEIKRYSDIKNNMEDITPKVLSARLKELERQKLINKTIDTSSFPVKTYYQLTERGIDFINVIQAIKKWTLKWKFSNKLCEASDCKNCPLKQ